MRVVVDQACASKLLVSSLACKLRRYKRIYRSIISTSRNRELSACQKEKKKCGRWWRCSYFLVEVEIFLSFVADFRGNINVNEIIANSDQNLNMRTLNFLSLCMDIFFFKFCRSCFTSLFTTLACLHGKYTRWNKETEAESRLPSFKNYLHTVVDASSLPLVNSSSSFGGVERANPANKWEVWNSQQKNTSSRKRKSRGMDKV